jgi:acetate kinase
MEDKNITPEQLMLKRLAWTCLVILGFIVGALCQKCFGGTLIVNVGGSSQKFTFVDDKGDLEPIKKEDVTKDFIENNVDEIRHRIVSADLEDGCIYDQKTAAAIIADNHIAPNHNPQALDEIARLSRMAPDVPQRLYMDSTYHSTRPDKAIAVPTELGLCRRGYHGIAASDAAVQTAAKLKKDVRRTNLVYLHFGSGQSVTAARRGLSVYNSMGYGANGGVIMQSRSGSVDPEIVLAIAQKYGVGNARKILSERGGLIALSDGKIKNFKELDESEPMLRRHVFDTYARSVTDHIAIALSRLDCCADAIAIGVAFDGKSWTIDQLVQLLRRKFPQVKNIFVFRQNEEKYIACRA